LACCKLGVKRLGDAGPGGAEHHRGAERGQPLGDAGIRHFERGGSADAALHHANVKAMGAKNHDPPSQLAGDIEHRPFAAGLRRRADNPAIDERRTRRRDDFANACDGRGRDRIAVDEDRLPRGGGEMRRHPLGEGDRITRRHDREDEIGSNQRRVLDGLHARGFRALRACCAAAGKRGRDAHPVLGEPAADRGAHIAGRNDRHGSRHSRLQTLPPTQPCDL
jgi:hypothetical protein